MPVVERRKLEIISQNELKEAENDVKKLEDLAKRKDRATKKIKARGGIFGGTEKTSNLPKALTQKREKELLERVTTPARGKNLLGAITRPDKIQQLESRLSDQEVKSEAFAKVFGSFGLIKGAAGSPGTALLTSGLGFAQKLFPVAIITGIATTLAKIYVDSYGKGGPNDIRVKILRDVFSRFGIEVDINVLTGKHYFVNSPTLRIGNETQLRSNTENLRDGAARSRLLRAPYGR